MTAMKIVSVRIPPDVIDNAANLARKHGITRSEWIRRALLIREALESEDQSREFRPDSRPRM